MSDSPRDPDVRISALVEQVPAIVYTQAASPPDAPAFAYLSPQCERILGYPPHDLVSGAVRWLDIVHDEDRELVRAADDEAERTGRPFRCEYRIRAKDGRWVWIRDESVLVPPDTDGHPAAWQGIMLDVTSSKEGERQLRSAEARFRTLVEQIHAVTYIDAIETEAAAFAPTLYISPQIEELAGYTPEEWMAQDDLWERIVHPDDHDRVLAEDAAMFREGTTYVLDYRIVHRDGHTVWVHEEAERLLDEQGNPTHWLGVMFDTSAAKETEQRLQEAEGRFRTLVERIPAVTFMEALEGVGQLYVSPQIEELYGYTVQEWLDDPELWIRLLHPDDRDRVLALDEVSERTGTPFHAEYRVIHRDGRAVWVAEHTELVLGADGEPLYWLGITRDITEAKLAEAQLREAEERFRTLVEQIPAVVYTESLQGGGLTYISPQIEQLVGFPPSQWLGDPSHWEERLHPDEREAFVTANEKADATLEPFSMQYRIRRRDGSWVWVEDTCVAILDADGEPLYWHGVIQDITERKRSEELERALEVEQETSQRLRELDEMKNTFLSTVSHDLRTPLSAILGLGITLDREEVELSEEERTVFVRRIVANARKLDALVNDLLDLDRLVNGAIEPDLANADVGALARGVVDGLGLLPEDHPFTLEADPVVVRVDGPKVERIIENLVTNAIRHTPPGTRVWVRVRPKDGGVLILVEDSGPGIPEDMRLEVFEMFRQVPGAPASHAPGAGVGLALVKRLTELHGGRVWVEERGGGGASFGVFLPGGP